MRIGRQEKRGSVETRDRRNMGMERHGTGETWDWINVEQEKRKSRETDMMQEKHGS